jgi:hypothetical protein
MGEQVKVEVEVEGLGRGAEEETWWVIGHLVSMEEHLFESGLLDQAALIRDVRRGFVEEWARALGLDGELLRRDWCVYKHAFALMVHLQEVGCGEAAFKAPELALRAHEVFEVVKSFVHDLVEYHRRSGGGGGERLLQV